MPRLRKINHIGQLAPIVIAGGSWEAAGVQQSVIGHVGFDDNWLDDYK